MTLRSAIQGLLEGPDPDSQGVPGGTDTPDVRSTLVDEGFSDLPADAFGTALVNYADTAPMEHADALAPIVTALGPVPEVSPLMGEDVENIPDAFQLFDTHPPHLEILPPIDEVDGEPELLDDAFGFGDGPADLSADDVDLVDGGEDRIAEDSDDFSGHFDDGLLDLETIPDPVSEPADGDDNLNTEITDIEAEIDDDIVGDDPADLDFDL